MKLYLTLGLLCCSALQGTRCKRVLVTAVATLTPVIVQAANDQTAVQNSSPVAAVAVAISAIVCPLYWLSGSPTPKAKASKVKTA